MRVLVVTHETSRTGAPRVALLATRSLRSRGFQVNVVARAAGPLEDEFRRVAPTVVEPLVAARGRVRGIRRLRGLAWLADTLVALTLILVHRPHLVYVSSSSAAVYLRPARWLRRKVLLHVHESGDVARPMLRAARAPRLPGSARLIACSPSVRRELAERIACAPEDIALLPSVPDDALVASLAGLPPDYDYPGDELVVGCCGAVESRKGADLWVTAARTVTRRMHPRPVRFVWVGEVTDPRLTASDPSIHFIGASANPYAHMRRFDVATLPSRDDPFPLVVLESMLTGTPMVAFAVGGVPEQVADAGVLVPPGDVDAFADSIVALLRDDEERRRLAVAARQRAEERFSTAAFQAGLADLVDSA